jgi:alpha-ketoglutarate-dependent taurine dioxygenase
MTDILRDVNSAAEPASQSTLIIVGLQERATSEQFSYSRAWQVGDLVIRDNTC